MELNKFASLFTLDACINLINKRPNIQLEFKKMDGYSMLQRIFTSIASLNRFTTKLSKNKQSNSYYGSIQKELFVVLLNGSFRKPVLCMNNYSSDKIEMCINKTKKEKNVNCLKGYNIYLINPDLLSKVIIEWTLWQPFETHSPDSKLNRTSLWKQIFEILNNLLEDDHSSQVYHSDVFIRFNLLDKLMHFLLDANGENCVFERNSCASLISIFKHFNSLHYGSSRTKRLFSNFFEYLHILHPENNAYIINSTGSFYYNLTLSKHFMHGSFIVQKKDSLMKIYSLYQTLDR